MNHAAATALHFGYYNLIRAHEPPGRPLTVDDLVALLDRYAVTA